MVYDGNTPPSGRGRPRPGRGRHRANPSRDDAATGTGSADGAAPNDQHGYGQPNDGHDYGQPNDQYGYGRSNDQRDYGQADNGQRGYRQPDDSQRDSGQHSYGPHGDYEHQRYEQPNAGQRYDESQNSAPDNAGPPDVEGPTVVLPVLGRAGKRLAAAKANAKPKRRWRRAVGWTAAALVVVLAGVSLSGYLIYRHYDGRIHREDVLAPNDPHIVEKTKQQHAANFLLIGSDTRSGANGQYESSAGEVAGARSDTTILAHLSPDGGKATMVSFPRDSWVQVPACRKPDGSISKPYMGMFNSAFELGGAACTIRLVQSLTGVEINHYVQVDFTGFKTMVSALGGVPVCTPVAIDDPDSGLKLHPGTQTLDGTQALAYVRARHNIGDGSDLGRIKRQQQFLGAMLRVATSKGILFSPGKLKKFLDAGTKSVTLDKQTHLGDLYSLAQQLRHLDAAHANFLTVPIANPDYTPPGTNQTGRVQLDLNAAKALWKSIIDDNGTVTVPATPTSPKATSHKPKAPHSATPSNSSAARLTVAPQDVTVKIVNGVGTPYLATRASQALSSVGFSISTLSIEQLGATNAVVHYAPSDIAAARTLAAAIPGATMQADNAVTAGSVELVVGSSWDGAHTVNVGDAVPAGSQIVGSQKSTAGSPKPSSSPSSLKSISAADKACSI